MNFRLSAVDRAVLHVRADFAQADLSQLRAVAITGAPAGPFQLDIDEVEIR